MAAPTTYSNWVDILERFGNGDDIVLEEMNEGSFMLDAGTVQRFYLRVEEVYKKRKQNWLDKFQRAFQIQNIKTDDAFGIALSNGRQNLLPISKFVLLKSFPEDLKKTLKNDLDNFIAEIKKSLKDNISKTNNSRDKILLMLNAFGLPEMNHEQNIKNNTDIHKEHNFILPAGRKIIF